MDYIPIYVYDYVGYTLILESSYSSPLFPYLIPEIYSSESLEVLIAFSHDPLPGKLKLLLPNTEDMERKKLARIYI